MEIFEHNGEIQLTADARLLLNANLISLSEFEKNEPIRTVYVPSHLYHILFELFKNSMRAVMEKHQDADTIPPLKVTIVKGKEDICLKISGELMFCDLQSIVLSTTHSVHFLMQTYHSVSRRLGRRHTEKSDRSSVQVHVHNCTKAVEIRCAYSSTCW